MSKTSLLGPLCNGSLGGRVSFQLGVIDEEAFRRTTEKGLAMVMDTCPAIEWNKRS